jgi:hypothetical protein
MGPGPRRGGVKEDCPSTRVEFAAWVLLTPEVRGGPNLLPRDKPIL